MAIITAPNIGDLICVQNWAQLCSSHFSKTLQKYNCELCTPYIIIILCTISAMTVSQGKDEYLGETRSAPVVQLDFTDQKVELKWLELKREGESAGELLAAFELVLNEGGDEGVLPYGWERRVQSNCGARGHCPSHGGVYCRGDFIVMYTSGLYHEFNWHN